MEASRRDTRECRLADRQSQPLTRPASSSSPKACSGQRARRAAQPPMAVIAMLWCVRLSSPRCCRWRLAGPIWQRRQSMGRHWPRGGRPQCRARTCQRGRRPARAAAGILWIGANFRLDIPCRSSSLWSIWAAALASTGWLWPPRSGAVPRAAILSAVPRRHEPRGAGDRYLSFLLSWVHVARLLRAVWRISRSDNARAGYVYLLMASFRTMALLLDSRLAGTAGLRIRGDSRRRHSALVAPLVLKSCAPRRRLQAGLVPFTSGCHRPSGRPEPRFGADERRDDEGAVYGFVRIIFDLLGSQAGG